MPIKIWVYGFLFMGLMFGTGEMIRGFQTDCNKDRIQKKVGIRSPVSGKLVFWIEACFLCFYIILAPFVIISEYIQKLAKNNWGIKLFFFILIVINLLIQLLYMKKEKKENRNQIPSKSNILIKCRWILKKLWLYGNISYFLLVCVILLDKFDNTILGYVTAVTFCIYSFAYFFYILINEIDAGEENIFNYLSNRKEGKPYIPDNSVNTLAPLGKMTEQKAADCRRKLKHRLLRKYISLIILFVAIIICATVFIVFIPDYTDRTLVIYIYGSVAIISVVAFINVCVRGYRGRENDINKELYFGKAVVVDFNPLLIQYKDSEGAIKNVSSTTNICGDVKRGKEVNVIVTKEGLLIDAFSNKRA